MKINEVDGAMSVPDPEALLGLVSFLGGRATDTGAKKQISQDAFIKLAQGLGININRQNLPELTNQPPLNNVLEPLQPNSSQPLEFKGNNSDADSTQMPVDRAQDIVAKNAKSALKRKR
jgi:hypothetical protein